MYVLSIEPHLWNLKINEICYFVHLWVSCMASRQSPDTSFSTKDLTLSSIVVSFLPCEGFRFSFNGTTYQNNSIVTLGDIGEGDNAFVCLTDQTACCRPPYTDSTGRSAIGNWFFPNGTRVPSSGNKWDFHITRGQSVVRLQRRRGGKEGIYHCVVPDAMNVDQTIYIGVYSRTDPQAGE